MKKISLNIAERIIFGNLLNEYSKDLTLSSYRLALKIADKIEIDEKEKKKVGFKVENERIVWKDSKYEKEIELSEDENTFVNSIFEQKDKDKNFSMKDGRETVALIDKIGEENGR